MSISGGQVALYPPGMGWTPVAAGGQPKPVFFSVRSPAAVLSPTAQLYPPGLGYTPLANSKPGVLQRKISFGLNSAQNSTPKANGATGRELIRKRSSNLASVLEAGNEEHQFSRELLLLFKGESAEKTEASDAGFLWPEPGFILTQQAPQEETPSRPPKAEQVQTKAVAKPAVKRHAKANASPGGGQSYSNVVRSVQVGGAPAVQLQQQVHPWHKAHARPTAGYPNSHYTYATPQPYVYAAR